MADYYTTNQKINLANNIIAEFCGGKTAVGYNAPIFAEIEQMEQKYISNNRCCDLSDFCIRLSEIPAKHFKLMLIIGWLDHDTEEPLPYLSGFYKSAYHGKQGFTEIEHFITVDLYINLLFIELEIAQMYKADC